MKRKRSLLVLVMLVFSMLVLAACGSSNNYILPTFAPTLTPGPKRETNNGATPTPAPDEGYERVIALDGEDFNQTSYFTVDGVSKLSVKKVAYSGAFSFCLSERDDNTLGVNLNFSNKNNNSVNVIGKNVHFAAWVYQETGTTAEFTCSLTVKKPDGISDTPYEFTVSDVRSNKWTLVECDIPVYSNVTNPTVKLNMTSSKDSFYYDDVRLTYDKSSMVAANQAYESAAVEALYFNFEDQQVHFTNRGDAESMIVEGSAEDGEYSLYVTNRTSTWNGIEIDLNQYGLKGKKLWVRYYAKHGSTERKRVSCTLQYREAGTVADQYLNITSTDSLFTNRWGVGEGTFEVNSMAESALLYFETESTDDFFIDEVLISTKDISEIDVADLKPDSSGAIRAEEEKEKIDTSRFTSILDLTADTNRNEGQVLSSRGSATTSTTGNGKTGDGFLVSGRTATWNGVSTDFTDLSGKKIDVIGKEVFISFWVYQDSGEPQEFSATLQVTKPNGDSAWPERVSIPKVESGEWTYVEGIVPVYGNANVPMLNFELPSSDTADFVLDDITIMYDKNSVVADNPDYVLTEQIPFPGLSLGFEDNDAFFAGRGNGKASIVYGGHESGKCLAVTERISTWHGVQADLSKYDLAGKTIEVSYWVYHEYSTEKEVVMSAEQNDGTNTTYTTVVGGEPFADGKWVKFTNTFTFADTAKKYVLYFESPDPEAEFFVDDVSIQLAK